MSYDFNNPEYWFGRAEELRTRSDLMRNPGNRDILLRIASDYERLGERAVSEAKRLREGGQIERSEPEIPNFAERAGTDEATQLQVAQSVLVVRHPRR